ncbi:class I SAM-dependent methyltransferase [Paracidovorax valerianellae]|uniref:Nodulation protein S (NodS) n=1 Tax=Paracidovorax valerianellae TaxID=187868 RepID=A0A1G7DYU5_9BURK|nr:class I SAM-dependent methyltransferase [Paracidovorax valerianellae]MDA8444548.1 class I SAM-dependent methyltransferase [Paracidovorax valerianellae]SDE56653.1 Nodulation protein S (NodS) [Paracidovorax valerianellae]
MAAPFADAGHFEQLHARSADPWGVHARWYERRKRDLLLAALPRARYAQGFEPGCSVGGNTLALAARCDQLIACDASTAALDRAAATLKGVRNVVLRHWTFPHRWPDTPSDLIVVAELAYYLPPEDFARFLAEVPAHLQRGGHLALCHWRAPVADAQADGDGIHGAARQALALDSVGSWGDEDMRIDIWQHGGTTSVAATGGAQERLASVPAPAPTPESAP